MILVESINKSFTVSGPGSYDATLATKKQEPKWTYENLCVTL